MSAMLESLEQYLAIRRSLGFKLDCQEGRLRKFVAYAEERGQDHITAKLAVDWAEHQCGPRTWASRLSTVRSFSRHVLLTDPMTEIPPSGIFAPQRRSRPFIYSDEQIADLLNAMPRQHPDSFRGVTYHYFFGLLASTGMRFSEAARLLREDADMVTGTLTIRETKFGKSRYIPLHPSTLAALIRYCDERDRMPARRASKFFFTGDRGRKLNHANPHLSFITWTREAGLRGSSEAEGPRIHDLRHSFAVRTLLDWYRNGENIDLRIPELSTFLGHGKVAHTYWYLSAHPELLEEAKSRLETRWEVSQ